jgi:hypothetical protein
LDLSNLAAQIPVTDDIKSAIEGKVDIYMGIRGKAQPK